MKTGIWCIVGGLLLLVVGFWLVSKDTPERETAFVADQEEEPAMAPAFEEAVIVEHKHDVVHENVNE